MLSSPDTLQVLLISFSFMAWSRASKSTILCQPDFAYTVINFTFDYDAKNAFGCYRGVMAQFELVKHIF